MKLKDYIKALQKYDGELIVTYGEGPVFLKEHTHLMVGDLFNSDAGLGEYPTFKGNPKGRFLVVDLTDSEPFDSKDLR